MKLALKYVLFMFLGCFYIQDAAAINTLVFDQKDDATVLFRKRTDLRISGSGQFSEKNFANALSFMSGTIWIIDLRRESHGFINGTAISWYYPENRSNVGLACEQIVKKESEKLESLKNRRLIEVEKITRKKEGKILQTISMKMIPHRIETEAELAKRLGVNYFRLPVTDHHRPDDSEVDTWIDFVKMQPKNTWLHFHCRGGKGRTSTFMVLYDILKNGKERSLKEIVADQHDLGGIELLKINYNPDAAWKKEAQIARKYFLENFYEYAVSDEGYPKISWQEWLSRRNK